jgi:hypothetical protein
MHTNTILVYSIVYAIRRQGAAMEYCMCMHDVRRVVACCVCVGVCVGVCVFMCVCVCLWALTPAAASDAIRLVAVATKGQTEPS